jgi:hypothetical protein
MPISAISLDPESRPSLLSAVAQLPLLAYRLLRWRALRGGWLADYFRHRRRFHRGQLPSDTPIDIIVPVVDHYEPARRHGDEAAVESVRSWCAEYENMARKHRDADGRPPQHTWFYRFDYPNDGCVQALSESAFRGFGEVEFHLHHSHDSHASFASTLQAGLDWFSRHGAMHTAEATPQRRFGYIAGNSALDNGAGDPALSGCNTELAALCDAGCYADFTFPALGSPAQPSMTNAIYYAREDGRAQSYDRGVPAAVGRPATGDLLIFQGPTSFHFDAGRVDDGMLENSSPAHPRRLRPWLDSHVYVIGRPEWVFIKLATHGMQSRSSFLRSCTDELFSAMEHWWNRPPFRLHYVTAREAFNVIKPAEAGHRGNPDDYRDFAVARPANRLIACDLPFRLLSYSSRRICLRLLSDGPARLEFAEGPLCTVTGPFTEVEIRIPETRPGSSRVRIARRAGSGRVELTGRDGAVAPVDGDDWVSCPAKGQQVLSVRGHALLDTKRVRP